MSAASAEFARATDHLLERLAVSAPELGDRLEAFVAASPPIDTHRSRDEMFDAQRLARALLLETKDYGAVYTWYEAFKTSDAPEDDDHIALLAAHAADCRDSFGFIRGHRAVLEVGAGASPIGLALADANASWTATDILRPDAFESVAAIVGRPANLRYEVANAMDLDIIPDGSVDVVVSRSFIEHLLVEDVHRFFDECHRVLEPGGSIVVFCPSSVGPPAEITRHYPQYRSVQGLHIQEWTVSELAVAVAAHGFGDVRSRLISNRGLGRLPFAVQRRNSVSAAAATRLEHLARRTNGMVYAGGARAKVWHTVWGHLGAAASAVTATRMPQNP